MSRTLADAYNRLTKAEKLKADPAQFEVLGRLQTLSEQLKQHRSKKLLGLIPQKQQPGTYEGMYIWGNIGRGKSMLMDLFFDVVHITKKKRLHFHAFMQQVHAAIHTFRTSNPDAVKKENPVVAVAEDIADATRLLCLDELQVTDVADAMILEQLFTTLFERGVVCVFTSNRPPKDLYQGGLQRDRFLRFVDMLTNKVEIVELKSPHDYRLQQIRAMKQVYFMPLGKEADKFFANTFNALTYPARPEERELEVQGRSLKVTVGAGNIARFTFQELCEKPLGAADYLEIAKHFHTVMVANIPMLTPERRNEAKRFVTLIDVLYDHKVNLICTAAAAPDKLYPAGDGSFEFQRTASRLMEMQSAGYLEASHVD